MGGTRNRSSKESSSLAAYLVYSLFPFDCPLRSIAIQTASDGRHPASLGTTGSCVLLLAIVFIRWCISLRRLKVLPDDASLFRHLGRLVRARGKLGDNKDCRHAKEPNYAQNLPSNTPHVMGSGPRICLGMSCEACQSSSVVGPCLWHYLVACAATRCASFRTRSKVWPTKSLLTKRASSEQ